MNFWENPTGRLSALLKGKAPLLRQVRQRHSRILEREVDMDIFLPPGYWFAPNTYYPLLLINDGQDLPFVRMAEILQDLYHQRAIPHLIVAGIYAGEERMREYGTARQADYKNRGDKAGRYAEFIVGELLPFLHLRFRCNGIREQTAFAGFSLGGLSALDIAWAYPQVFGVAGVFSGALWWRSSPVDPADPDADRIMHHLIEHAPPRVPDQRFWFQAGTHDETEDRNGNGVIDAIDDTLDLMRSLRKQGYTDERLRYFEVPGGEHNPATWGKAMPDFLGWAFGKQVFSTMAPPG